MPEDSVYGEWPKSGEIDIIEARGNDAETYSLGNNIVTSTLHWGTTYLNDAYLKSTSDWGAQRTKYSEGYHTYGLEWTEDYMFTWLDGRLRVWHFLNYLRRTDANSTSDSSKSSTLTLPKTRTCGPMVILPAVL